MPTLSFATILTPSDYHQYVYGIGRIVIPYHRLNAYISHNLYDILGITIAATSSEIKEAYYGEVLRWHVDNSPEATDVQRIKHVERFKAISSAYETLSDNDLHEQYKMESEKAQDISLQIPSTMQYKDAVKIFLIFIIRIIQDDKLRNESILKVISTLAIATCNSKTSFVLGGAMYALLQGSKITDVFNELTHEEQSVLIETLTLFILHERRIIR